MESTRASSGAIVDLLDRVLDKGLVLDADLVICLAGVPLIGINLRAALAGMETMVRYGFMTDWDESIRAQQRAPEVGEKAGLTAVGSGLSRAGQ